VQIQDGTLVTDRGTLLRGAFVAINNPWNEMPSRENVTAIKNLGLNCIHLYAESYWDENRNGAGPGYLFDKVDSLVTWTAQDSLYLIITFAGLDINIDTNVTFVKDCWEIYSERYKDETHVIFEIFNEPTDVPYSDAMITLEKELYDIIRSNAPETHILLLSPWNFFYDEILTNIEMLDNVDWSNSSIAGHAYQRPAQDYIEPINRIKDAGYAITVTEFHSFMNEYANLALTRVFEQEYVSYLHFIDLNKLIDDPSVFKSRIESSEVRWTPDFGTWPESITEINYQSPYRYWPAIFYDEGSGWINDFEDEIITYISNNEYVAYYNINFQDWPSSFEACCSATASDGRIELRLDSLNGQLVGVCQLSGTGSLENYETFPCNDIISFTGVHDLYLKFRRDDNSPMFNIRSWYFINSELSATQTPFHGSAIVIPGKIEAEEYDYGGQTISFLDIDTANQGFFFRDDDVDIDSTRDGGYCIGWTGSGEWIEYTVSCQHDTAIDIQLRVACTKPGYKFNIKLDNQLLVKVSLPNTGGYYTWETITIEDIQIPAGEDQIMRIEFLDGYMNLDWMNFVVSNPSDFDEVKNNKTFTFYPNPAYDYIKVKSAEPVQIEIYSLQGQLLIKKKISTDDDLIPVGNLTSGSYFIKILNRTRVFSDILIIE
jgi:hypothetical protein